MVLEVQPVVILITQLLYMPKVVDTRESLMRELLLMSEVPDKEVQVAVILVAGAQVDILALAVQVQHIELLGPPEQAVRGAVGEAPHAEQAAAVAQGCLGKELAEAVVLVVVQRELMAAAAVAAQEVVLALTQF